MVGLIGNERAQRIHEHADEPGSQSAANSMHVEDERLAPAGSHDRKRILPLGEAIERTTLRLMQRPIADHGADQGIRQFCGVVGRKALPTLASLALLGFAAARTVRARLSVFAAQIVDELHILDGQARLQRRAGACGLDHVEHALHRAAAAPFVDLDLERRIDHAAARHEFPDAVAVKHDGVDRRRAVGERAGQVVLAGAYRSAIRQTDVARKIARREVFLAERSQAREGIDAFERQFAQIDQRINFDKRMEAILGQRIHISAEALGEFRQLVGGKRYAHGGFVAAEAREDIGCRFDRLEQVHPAHASARSPGFAIFDREQQGGNAVCVHQARCNDSLHAFMPAFARHDERALTRVDFIGLALGLFGQVGLDRAAGIVDQVELSRLDLSRLEIVGHQQFESQIGIAHATCRIKTRNERERQIGG